MDGARTAFQAAQLQMRIANRDNAVRQAECRF